MSSTDKIIRVQWLTKNVVNVYDVLQEKGVITSWKYLDSYSHTSVDDHDLIDGVRDQQVNSLNKPYLCNYFECEALADHTLYCLVDRIVKLSPTNKVHVEKIMCQLSRLNNFYYQMPVWELNRRIRASMQTDYKKSVVKLKGDYCYLALACNDDNILEPAAQDLSIKSAVTFFEPIDYNYEVPQVEEASLLLENIQPTEDLNQNITSQNVDGGVLRREADEAGSEIPSKIKQMIMKWLKKSREKGLSTSEIFNQVRREDPSIKSCMVYESLFRDPRVKKCNKTNCWKLTKPRKFDWKSKILVVLKDKFLSTKEICDLLQKAYPEVKGSKQWYSSVCSSLNNSKCFVKTEVSPGLVCWSNKHMS